eukprot:3985495-Pleurochrysis_carterae.AAC.6
MASVVNARPRRSGKREKFHLLASSCTFKLRSCFQLSRAARILNVSGLVTSQVGLAGPSECSNDALAAAPAESVWAFEKYTSSASWQWHAYQIRTAQNLQNSADTYYVPGDLRLLRWQLKCFFNSLLPGVSLVPRHATAGAQRPDEYRVHG